MGTAHPPVALPDRVTGTGRGAAPGGAVATWPHPKKIYIEPWESWPPGPNRSILVYFFPEREREFLKQNYELHLFIYYNPSIIYVLFISGVLN